MAECIKCGEIICPAKARYYKPPLSNYCSECRKKELDKQMVKK